MLLRRMGFTMLLDIMFYICLLGQLVYSVVQIYSFLIDPLIIETRVLTTPTIIVLTFIFPINSVSICFT